MFKSFFSKIIFKNIKTKKCNFCDCNESEGNPFLVGHNSSICKNCVWSAYVINFGYVESSSTEVDWDDKYNDDNKN